MKNRLSKRFTEALAYAAELHHEQTRKGSDIPYLTHLMAVAGLVLEHGGNEDEAIAGLLHDAIEDQGKQNGGATMLRETIARCFGPSVLELVEGCTETDTDPKPPWRERKEAYLNQMQRAPMSVLRISCADKLHNARTLLVDYRVHGEGLWDRFNAGSVETLWFYRALMEVYRDNDLPQALVDELERTIGELERLVG